MNNFGSFIDNIDFHDVKNINVILILIINFNKELEINYSIAKCK